MHYRYRGQCLPIEVLERPTRGSPTPGDQTPAGAQTLRAERTKLGLVAGRGDRRAASRSLFTKLRSTYFHEVDSRGRLHGLQRRRADRARPGDFQRAATRSATRSTGSTPTPKHIAYFNSGANPVRAEAASTTTSRCAAKYEWRGWNPDAWTASFTPPSRSTRRRSTRRTSINWNNKQARGFRGLGRERRTRPTYRSVLLEDRAQARDPRRAQARRCRRLIDAMELAGTTDLRAHVGPAAARCKVIGRPARPGAARRGRRRCAPGCSAGGLRTRRTTRRRLRARRRDPDHGRLVAAVGAGEFQPALGASAFRRAAGDRRPRQRAQQPRPAPRLGLPGRLVRLRAQGPAHVLGRKVRGPYSREYCGGGTLEALPGGAAALAGAPRSRSPASDALRRRPGVRGRGRRATSGASTRSASARSAAPPSR